MKSVSVSFQSIQSAKPTSDITLGSKGIGAEFRDLKRSLQEKPLESKSDAYTELNKFQQRIMSGKALSAQEIISYQIKAHHFGMQVELVSKVAESAVSSLKRLQTPQ